MGVSRKYTTHIIYIMYEYIVRPGRIGTKTTVCLRELHSLTVSKSVRFLYQEGAAGKLNFPYDGLKTYSFRRVETSGNCTLPAS